MLDVIMISFGEPSADENFSNLQKIVPRAKRVDGVVGLLQAHQAAARISETDYFYVVDADAVISEEFGFKFVPSSTKEAYEGSGIMQTDCVFTYRSRNPINDLIYGYGGVKVFPKHKLLQCVDFKVDMTTSIGATFVPLYQISNITQFNTDPFNTWRSAFRECTKLASSVIDNNISIDDKYRLDVWCSRGEKRKYGEYALIGAEQGREFGTEYRGNPDALKKINDWEWLKETFNGAL